MVGPSPRAWGSERPIRRRRLPDRSIPTCVGLGSVSAFSENVGAVHPHVRGARERVRILRERRGGPSPRAWGSVPAASRGPGPRRSIPTCVGLGLAVNVVARTREVHPHVRGARGLGRGLLGRGVGPSPRAWGSVRRRTACGSGARSIPTCVGLGWIPEAPPEGAAVHPHVRGARLLIVVLDEAHTGPSPRAWGSGAGCGSSTTQGRSIPTCVGLGPVLRRGL